jgi:hypothetical protein
MQDIAHGHSVSAELSRTVVSISSTRPLMSSRQRLRKLLDVKPVNGRAAIITEVPADGLSSTQPSKIDLHV